MTNLMGRWWHEKLLWPRKTFIFPPLSFICSHFTSRSIFPATQHKRNNYIRSWLQNTFYACIVWMELPSFAFICILVIFIMWLIHLLPCSFTFSFWFWFAICSDSAADPGPHTQRAPTADEQMNTSLKFRSTSWLMLWLLFLFGIQPPHTTLLPYRRSCVVLRLLLSLSKHFDCVLCLRVCLHMWGRRDDARRWCGRVLGSCFSIHRLRGSRLCRQRVVYTHFEFTRCMLLPLLLQGGN